MKARQLEFCVVVVAAASLMSCNDAAWHLDRIAKDLEDYGTVTISGATLIEPDPRFVLDLNLTGEQLLNRNRVEGFSNIYSAQAMDVQISVHAEIIKNLMGQLQGAQDPKMVEQLRNALLAASFQGMIANLPEEERKKYGDLLKPVTDVLTRRPGTGGVIESDSDGGEALAGQAKVLAAEVETAMNEVKDALSKYQSANSSEKEVQAKSLTTAATQMAEKAEEVAEKVIQASKQASRLASQADGEFAVSDAKPSGVAESIKVAKAKAGEAETLATKLKALAEKALSEANSAAINTTNRAADWHTKLVESAERIINPPEEKDDKGNVLTKPSPKNTAALAAEAAAEARAAAGGIGVKPKVPEYEQPYLDVPKLPALSDRLAYARARDFKDPLPNYEGPLNLNMEKLLTLVGSEKSLLSMLQWNSYPTNYGPGSRVYLCMGSVNVVPGRKTHEGYMGQVNVSMRYGVAGDAAPDRKCAKNDKCKCRSGCSCVVQGTATTTDGTVSEWNRRIEPIKGDARPSALTVFPLVNAQVLDLRTSRRQIFSMAVQLMVSGYPVAANALFDYMRQFEQDAMTLTALNTVSSYGNGSNIGFTFSADYRAQKELSKATDKPGLKLQPWSFPVIVLISCDERIFTERTEVRERKEKESEAFTDLKTLLTETENAAKTIRDTIKKFLELGGTTVELAGLMSVSITKPAKHEPGVSYIVPPSPTVVKPLETIHNALKKYHDKIREVKPPNLQFSDLLELERDLWNVFRQTLEAKEITELQSRLDAALEQFESAKNQEKRSLGLSISQLRELIADAVGTRIEALLRQTSENLMLMANINQGPRYILWNQSHRWMQAREYWFAGRQSEYAKLQTLKKLDALTCGYFTRYPEQSFDEWNYENVVRDRARYLVGMSYGTTVPLRLPVFDRSFKLSDYVASGEGSITVEPMRGWANRESTFFVSHDNRPFTGDYLVTVGGKRVNAVKLSNGVLRVTVPPWIDSLDLDAVKALQGDDKDSRFKAHLVVTDGVRIYRSGKEIEFTYWAPTPEVSMLADPGVSLGVQVPEASLLPRVVKVEKDQAVGFAVGLSRPVADLKSGTMTVKLGKTDNGQQPEPVVFTMEKVNSQRLRPIDEMKGSDFLKNGTTFDCDAITLELNLKRDEKMTLQVQGEFRAAVKKADTPPANDK